MPKFQMITRGGNLQGIVPPSEDAGKQFQIDMLVDAINFHQNGDDEDGPCCTGENPCNTRIWLIQRQREIAGTVIAEREVAREEFATQVRETQRAERVARQTPGNGVVADLASDKQIAFITSLIRQHDTSKIGTFPRRTLEQIQRGEEVSKRRASSLIEVLRRQPKIQAEIHQADTPAGPLASPAQLGFLRTLCAEQGEEIRTSYTKQEASDEITRLLANRDKPQARTSGKTADEGMYEKDGVVYKIQIAVHGSGRPYAKKLEQNEDGTWSFVKAPGMQFRLSPADKMTKERAQELGRSADSPLYGTCCVCGRTLTDETSIAEGIGPKCGNRF